MDDGYLYLFEETIDELQLDFNGNVEDYKDFLEKRLDIANTLNKLYGSESFKPFNCKRIKDQLNILDKLGEIKDLKDIENIVSNEEVNGEENNVVVFDPVNKPYHYASGKYECIEVMRDTFGDERLKEWCVLNAFKYLYRHHKKNGVEDLKKARFYLDYVIEKLN